jgi:hypothetical protein
MRITPERLLSKKTLGLRRRPFIDLNQKFSPLRRLFPVALRAFQSCSAACFEQKRPVVSTQARLAIVAAAAPAAKIAIVRGSCCIDENLM